MLNFSYFQNDQCSNTTDLGAFTDSQNITVTGQTNVGATDNSSEAPSCMITGPTYGVWYKLNIAFAARIEVSTCNQADFDTQIQVFSGACGSLVCEAFADNTMGCGSYTTCVVDDVMARDIYILVSGYGVYAGNFNLAVSVTALPPEVSGGCTD